MLLVNLFLLTAPSILYINSDKAVDRNEFFSKQFSDTNVQLKRISSVNTESIDVNEFDVTIVDTHPAMAGSGGYKNHMRQIYSKAEISLLLTYKKALQYAVDNKLEPPFVIAEDDVRFESISVTDVIRESQKAPEKWEILQFYTLNDFAQSAFCNILEPFVRWFPEYYSTAVTVVKDTLTAIKIIETEFSGHHVLDHWLYTNFQTFTHTLNWFSTQMFSQRINQIQEASNTNKNCVKPLTKQTSKLKNICMALVTTSTTSFYKDVFQKTIFPDNVAIHVIAKKNDFPIPELKTFYWIPNGQRFSKWVYFQKLLEAHIKSGSHFFEYYLFTDDDILFAGFPWLTLNEKLQADEPNIIGIPRESNWANTIINLADYERTIKRDFFVHSNGDFWRQLKNKMPNRWSFVHGRSNKISTDNIRFLEQGCTMLKTTFVKWFFHNIESVISKMDVLRSDWVIDTMWCEASYDFSGKYCQIFEHPVWHFDKGSLTSYYTNSKTFERNGHKLTYYTKRNSTFSRWIENAYSDMKLFAKMHDFDPSFDNSINHQ